MHPGIIILGWIIVIAVAVVGLLASGIVTIRVEIDRKDDEEADDSGEAEIDQKD